MRYSIISALYSFQPFKYSLRTPLAANQLFQFHSFIFGLKFSIGWLANILQSITTKSQTIKKKLM